ncbi:hypothetical protein BCR34DRAFT_629882 [Clohesyomyces aquaticus]|uniref:Uncharacterized protein n=1 Tax=Clohesyomyces aquaticus TaxID=1231657 RepID=A0A1Y2AB47_9PLEO|nr:hypothetical protein BCR34DRAFT_629882 [Clohesyomyces aquaticus]
MSAESRRAKSESIYTAICSAPHSVLEVVSWWRQVPSHPSTSARATPFSPTTPPQGASDLHDAASSHPEPQRKRPPSKQLYSGRCRSCETCGSKSILLARDAGLFSHPRRRIIDSKALLRTLKDTHLTLNRLKPDQRFEPRSGPRIRYSRLWIAEHDAVTWPAY